MPIALARNKVTVAMQNGKVALTVHSTAFNV
jgi:hypothetical protein